MFLFSAILFVHLAWSGVHATTFTVTSPNGLAAALSAANANPGLDLVVIAPSTGSEVQLTAALPQITDALVLEGGGVTIKGTLLTNQSGPGLWLTEQANGSSVAGLTLTGFPGTAVLWAASNGVLKNTYVNRNGGDGLYLAGNNNTIDSTIFGNMYYDQNLGNRGIGW
jgi:hypothetical protein